jgi:hypothetical protein
MHAHTPFRGLVRSSLATLALAALMLGPACSDEDSGGGTGGAGGSTGGRGGTGGSTGGTGGSTGGTGGSTGGTGGSTGGTGGSTGGTGGSTGGTGGSTGGTGGSTGGTGGTTGGTGGSSDAGKMDGGKMDGGTTDSSTAAVGQGPTAEGKVVFSRDFEDGNMAGLTRSPNGLPEDRIQMVDDPTGQRGKIVRIHFQSGDNFRTSGGTEPRSWFSSASGYTVRPGTTVSVAWGFMWENPSMGAHFAQIIRDGGPLWMFGVDQGGTVSAAVHRGSGGTGGIMKLEAMKWYDFRVDTEYRGGGSIKFYVNGKLVGQGRGDGGAPARFDCGIYWMHNGKPTRTVFLSNLSIGEVGGATP